MFKLAKKLLIVLVVSVLMISMVTATVHAVSTPKTIDKKDTEIVKIESKEKTTKYKITWNGNGGKIGSKTTVTTTVKKGSKIGKLVTPKRSSYTFKGWYTKKTGGTKITKNTKPKKSLTYYAKWKKTTSASKIVGHWQKNNVFRQNPSSGHLKSVQLNYYFYANGKFQYFDTDLEGQHVEKFEGKYSVSNGKVYIKECKYYRMTSSEDIKSNLKKFTKKDPKIGAYFGGGIYLTDLPKWTGKWNPVITYNDMTTEYKLSSNYLKITTIRNLDPPNSFTLSSADTFRKMS